MIYFANIAVIIVVYLWKKGKILREDPITHEQWIRAVCIGQSEADQVISKYRKQKTCLFYLVLIGCMVSMGIGVWQETFQTKVEVLQRPEYGSGSRVYRLRVKGVNEKADELELEVTEQRVTPEEQRKFLEAGLEQIPEYILGQNESLEEVRKDLNLPSSYNGIRLNWTSLEPSVISDWGEITADDLPETGTDVCLQVEAIYQENHIVRSFQITVRPPERTEEEKNIEGIRELFARAEQDAGNPKEVILPEEYQGKKLTFYRQEDNLALEVCLLSVFAAIALFLYFRQQPARKLRERGRQLELDYAEVITRLTIYIRAGMSIRGAWERIAKEYMVRRQEGGEIHYAYEEMLLSCYRMESGIPEEAAYGEFGRQCGLHSYLRLGGLLEQNVRKGGTELLRLLEQEAGEAFEEQKNMARKIGEEAETKMLLPMGMMLGVVLIILIVPVFSGLAF